MGSDPSAQEQIQFLLNIQRLLNEGNFVATYKYALLLSLADLSVEHGEGGGNALMISTAAIAEKFIQYYWRQSLPFAGLGGERAGVLWQNTGPQAAVVKLLEGARKRSRGSLTQARKDGESWASLRREVEKIVRIMPLWKLQTLGKLEVPFLYDRNPRGRTIELKPGVAYNFRRFHELLRHLLEGAWVRHVRSIARNQRIIGETADLRDFLFGSERENVARVGPVLRDCQAGACFYCGKAIRGNGDVDHFVPWSQYPIDLGHNFVVAHPECNRAKRDFLAGEPHLEHWVRRNSERGAELEERFASVGVAYDLCSSREIAHWAYQQAEVAKAQLWWAGNDVRPIGGDWRALFSP